MDTSTNTFDPATITPSRTYRRSDTIGALAAALSKTQGALHPAKKTKTQSAFKDSTYAGLDDAWTSARGPLSSNGLAIIQLPINVRDGWVSLTTILAHTSDEWIEATFSMPVEKQTAHGYGSCLTYLRRYALNSFIGLVSSADDDDGNAASGVTQPAPQKNILIEPRGFTEWSKELLRLALKRPYTEAAKAELLAYYAAASVDFRAYLAQEKPNTHGKIHAQATEKTT
tara:strand:- start:135 stop:818 length:684 start_codon:yes stop_codon:yes gene_type:complete